MLIEVYQVCMIQIGVLQAKLQLLRKGKAKTVTVTLSLPARLIPVQGGRPPPYFIFAGLVFLQATVPYLRSEYGKEFDFEAPVKLLVRRYMGITGYRLWFMGMPAAWMPVSSLLRAHRLITLKDGFSMHQQ